MPDVELTPKQTKFAEAVFSDRYRYLFYGGAVGGAKTWCVLLVLIMLCRIFKGSRWAVVRKDLPTLKRTVIPSFEMIRPKPFVGDINRTDWIAKCANGSEILFFPESLKDDPHYTRWLGLEVNGFVFEQAEELAEKTFTMAINRAGRWKAQSKEQPPPLILGTTNPTQRWPKRMFYLPWMKGSLRPPYYFLQAKMTDNPHLTAEYLEAQERLKEVDEAGYNRFVKGDWDASDDPDQLIKLEWILAAKVVEPEAGLRRLGVGNDDSCIAEVEGNRLCSLEYEHGINTRRLGEIVQARMHERSIGAERVFVDVVGLGAGVVDYLAGEEINVVEVVGGAKMIEREDSVYRYYNLRSQLWWEMREAIRKGELCIDVDDYRLIEDLTAPRYTVSGDKVVSVESKDSIKKRLGRSPDAGDALAYALADIPVPVVVEPAFV